jgi:hypothetical protein
MTELWLFPSLLREFLPEGRLDGSRRCAFALSCGIRLRREMISESNYAVEPLPLSGEIED